MKRAFYTEEHLQYLREIAPGKSTYEITDLFNAKFCTNKSRLNIKSCMSNHKIHSGMHNKVVYEHHAPRITTREQDEAIREKFHNKGGTWRDVQEFLRVNFSLELTLTQIKHLMATRGIRLGTFGRFTKGHISAFKGKHHTPEALAKIKRTMIKLGNRPHNQQEVGTEIVDSMGYVRVKIAEPNVWKFKSHIIWERETGEQLGPNERILFLDGNKLNLSVDNLAKVNLSELSCLNLNHWISSTAEITKAHLNLVRLQHIIARRLKHD